MKFCKKCGNLLSPRRIDGFTIWYCETCNIEYKEEDKNKVVLSQKNVENKDTLVVVKENKESLPITEKECPKCGHDKVYWWTMQTRASDEPETRFYKCVKCSYTWREYS